MPSRRPPLPGTRDNEQEEGVAASRAGWGWLARDDDE